MAKSLPSILLWDTSEEILHHVVAVMSSLTTETIKRTNEKFKTWRCQFFVHLELKPWNSHCLIEKLTPFQSISTLSCLMLSLSELAFTWYINSYTNTHQETSSFYSASSFHPPCSCNQIRRAIPCSRRFIPALQYVPT